MGDQPKLNEFEPPTYDTWLKLVERDLAGAPFDKKLVKRVAGVDIQPLYTSVEDPKAAGLPGFTPFARGSFALGGSEMGWDVRQEVAHADVKRAAASVADQLLGGATSLLLTLDAGLRAGAESLAGGGIALSSLEELETILGQAKLAHLPISLDAGAQTLPVVAGLALLAEKQTGKMAALTGCFGADPLAQLAATGNLPGSLDDALTELAELAAWSTDHTPGARAVLVDTRAYHNAGADAATEIAVALATGLAYLRALTAHGLSVDAAAKQLVFGFSVGRDFFVEIAKLRAARSTWAKVVAACGASEDAQAMIIHARTSLRTKTQRDPWVNLLRGTAESFSAAVGGADIVTTGSFDEAIGESDAFAERMARNTQHVLRFEANVHRVVDPAGGSYYVEHMSEELAKHAWHKLNELEKAGGMAAVLSAGSLQRELSAVRDSERKAVETRKVSVTGVNEFALVTEQKVERSAGAVGRLASRQKALPPFARGKLVADTLAAVRSGATFPDVARALVRGERATCEALTAERLALPFERLRDTADRAAAAGKRPSVFLVTLGATSDFKARATYAQNFFECGGFTVTSGAAAATADEAQAAFANSGADVACLCSSDTVYADLAAATATALREYAPKAIVLAGAPGDKEAAYRAAGVTDFISMGVNVVACLRSLLERTGAV